ncbi:calcineurin-like phosphoesterase family protein [Mycolicibacterium hassiacum DSM 44199]|uniref:Calcineurin-like phosphoesterase family protein n=1 Tax=Mycolicibacterium hassiacum (strain DSM 44199 / CIP 105218 / JCM 12690 / 3849) TaxID=1122247 RepID=K5BCV8_MYCHD|nr:calcineurin-like phosphoesterase family protein [Mycolicibacterium hassiacum DSM 44199]
MLGAVLALISLYLWQRLIRDTTRPGRVRRVLTAAHLVLTTLLFAALIGPRFVGVNESRWYAWPGYLWLGAMWYLLLLLLAFEPVRLVLRAVLARRARANADPGPDEPAERPNPDRTLDRRLFLARAGAVAAGAVSVGLVGIGAATALGPPAVVRLPVRLRRLDPALGGYRVAVVSDIHLGPLMGRAHTERIVAMINRAEPDLVAIVGDLVDGTVDELGRAAEPLRDLVSRDGVFFVTGNHEYFVDDPDGWVRELDRLGVHTLRNENTLIRRGGAAFHLAGVNDLVGNRRADGPDLDRALSGVDAARPTVLLAHQPVLVGEAARRGVDLQLSGHTHGGQLWPFHYLVRLEQPALAGLSAVGDTQLYVTRGAGFWGPPVRIGAPPDITVLTLQPGT